MGYRASTTKTQGSLRQVQFGLKNLERGDVVHIKTLYRRARCDRCNPVPEIGEGCLLHSK